MQLEAGARPVSGSERVVADLAFCVLNDRRAK